MRTTLLPDPKVTRKRKLQKKYKTRNIPKKYTPSHLRSRPQARHRPARRVRAKLTIQAAGEKVYRLTTNLRKC